MQYRGFVINPIGLGDGLLLTKCALNELILQYVVCTPPSLRQLKAIYTVEVLCQQYMKDVLTNNKGNKLWSISSVSFLQI